MNLPFKNVKSSATPHHKIYKFFHSSPRYTPIQTTPTGKKKEVFIGLKGLPPVANNPLISPAISGRGSWHGHDFYKEIDTSSLGNI